MNEQTRLTRPEPLVPFTADDFVRMMDLGAFAAMRAELVRGEIEKMMPAHWSHGELNATLVALLRAHLRPIGARIGTDVVIRIADTTVRAADIAVVHPSASPGPVLLGSELLFVVEVADTTLDRDMADKRVDYARAGIANYWVVDLNREVVHVFGDPVEGDYAQVKTVRFGEPLAVPGTDATIELGSGTPE